MGLLLSVRLAGVKISPPKTFKTSRHLIDSVFQVVDEALKGAERRPTAQKGGAHVPLDTTLVS